MKPDTNDMHPVLLERYLKWKFMVNEGIGLQMNLTCIKRISTEQVALYAQGRKELAEVNRLRKIAGMYLIGNKENSYKVTWTLASKHFPDINGNNVRAFDYALLVPGKKIITWDTKWDADHDGVPEFLECARLAKECGLEAGGLWTKPDFPHIQLPADVI